MVFAALCWALWKVWGRSSLLLHRVQANAAAQYPLRHFAVVVCNIKRKHYKQQYTVVDSKKIAWTDLLYTVQVYSIQWDNSSISSSSPWPSSREMRRAKSELVKNQNKLVCKNVIAAKRKNYCIAFRRTKLQPRVRYAPFLISAPDPPQPSIERSSVIRGRGGRQASSLLFITGAPLSCLPPTNEEPFISGRDMRVAGYEICPRRTRRPPPNKTTSCPLASTRIEQVSKIFLSLYIFWLVENLQLQIQIRYWNMRDPVEAATDKTTTVSCYKSATAALLASALQSKSIMR